MWLIQANSSSSACWNWPSARRPRSSLCWVNARLNHYNLTTKIINLPSTLSDTAYFTACWTLLVSCLFSSPPHLSPDDLLVQVVPEHLELRHWLLDGAAIGFLGHLLQQEARLVVQSLHLDLQLVGLLFELLNHRHKQQREYKSQEQIYRPSSALLCAKRYCANTKLASRGGGPVTKSGVTLQF